MEDVFVLPEKWCVRRNRKNAGVLNDWNNNLIEHGESFRNVAWHNGSDIGGDYFYSDKAHSCTYDSSYTEITFDQFKQYVLGEKQQQKEIVGYNVKESFSSIAFKLLPSIYKGWGRELGFDIDLIKKDNINIYKQAGVLDLWFTPVYKQDEPEYKVGDFVVVKNYVQCGEGNGVVTTNLVSELFEVKKNGATGMHYKESAFSVKERGNYYNIKEWHIVRKATPEEIKSAQTPQITINGYKGEFFDWGISFNSGCAKIQKEIFISLSKHIGQKFEYTNREVESITIGKGTFTKEQIKEIAEFYLNK